MIIVIIINTYFAVKRKDKKPRGCENGTGKSTEEIERQFGPKKRKSNS